MRISQVRCGLSWKVQMIMKNPSQKSQQNSQPYSHGYVGEVFIDFFCRVGSVIISTKMAKMTVLDHFSRAAKRGCFKRGGFPIWTCPSFFVLLCPFLDFPGDFPDLSGDSPGIFPIGPFPLSRPIISTYEEQSRKGPRHNLDRSRKKWETPGFGNPRV